jgi:hypothetical protein
MSRRTRWAFARASLPYARLGCTADFPLEIQRTAPHAKSFRIQLRWCVWDSQSGCSLRTHLLLFSCYAVPHHSSSFLVSRFSYRIKKPTLSRERAQRARIGTCRLHAGVAHLALFSPALRQPSKKSFDFKASHAGNEKQLCVVGETGRSSFGRIRSDQ